ncbi:MAG TPA: glycosyltransferase family 4 protein [Dermatophilaceae bacterium]|jgi:glycosyltransferase involved in cell wall biosynthesis
MKVVMLLGRSTGGIGTHVAQLSAELRDRGVDVLVVTHPLTAERFDLGPVRLCWPGSAGLVHALRDLRVLRRLVAGGDIVHAHGHQAGLLAAVLTRSVPSIRAARRRAPRLIVSQHNAVLEGSGRQVPKRLSQRWVARHADLVTGASSDLVNEALGFGAGRAELAEVPSPRVPALLARLPADQVARARIRQELFSSLAQDLVSPVAPAPVDPVDPASAAPAHSLPPGDPGAPLVVTISRIAPQKNLPVLVEAASRLRRRCTWVVLGAGDPQLLAELRRQASALAAPVYFLGQRDEVDQWLRAAEVFVLPSEWEARALVVQEAMAAGTPVVATDVGGLHDLVLGTGLLVPPGDPEAVATATDRILTDPRLRDELAARGRERASALPDGPDTAARWMRWYSETLLMT